MELRDPEHKVSPRARLSWLAEAVGEVAVLVIALIVASGWWHWFPMPLWAWIVVAAGGVGYALAMPRIRYAVHRWETTASAVYTQSGWISRERRIAPLSRVQTIDFEQGPLSRILRLASVRVTTASAAGPVRIKGLDQDVAERIVAELTARTAATTGDAT